MLKKINLFWILISLLFVYFLHAEDKFNIFNQYVYIEKDNFSFKLINIPVDNSLLWGKFTINQRGNFELKKVEFLNDKEYFNVLKLYQSIFKIKNVYFAELKKYNIKNIDACMSIKKIIFSKNHFLYFCICKNYIRFFFERNRNKIKFYSNWSIPIYLANNYSYSFVINTQEISIVHQKKEILPVIEKYKEYYTYTVQKINKKLWLFKYNFISDKYISLGYRIVNIDNYKVLNKKYFKIKLK